MPQSMPIHPFLLPSEWLVTARFLDPEGGEVVSTGAASVVVTEQFPEILQVTMELREVGKRSYSPSQSSAYHLEIVGSSQLRYRMDSVPLGTILVGEGSYTDRSLILSYRSPDRRFVGFDAFTVSDPTHLMACGAFLADGAMVKTWEVELEAVPNDGAT